MKLTSKEITIISFLEHLNHPIWAFELKNKFSNNGHKGVISSLVKKGLLYTDSGVIGLTSSKFGK